MCVRVFGLQTIKMEVKKEEQSTNEYQMDTDASFGQQQPERPYTNCNGLNSKMSGGDCSSEYSSISTAMCADRFVDDLCFMIGSAADNWGYLEGEIIFLISQRLKVFFRTITEWTKKGKQLPVVLSPCPNHICMVFSFVRPMHTHTHRVQLAGSRRTLVGGTR